MDQRRARASVILDGGRQPGVDGSQAFGKWAQAVTGILGSTPGGQSSADDLAIAGPAFTFSGSLECAQDVKCDVR